MKKIISMSFAVSPVTCRAQNAKVKMKAIIITGLLAVASLLGMPLNSDALVIDFENLLYEPNLSRDIQAGGFNFDFKVDHAHLLNDTHLGIPSNGTTYLAVDDELGDNPASMTPLVSSAAIFSLNSVDIAEFFIEPSTQLLVTGQYSNGGTVSMSLVPDGVFDGIGGLPDFQTFTFDESWSDLVSVTFDSISVSGTHQGWAMDNIVLNETRSVPEPSALLLIGSGLLGLAFMGKKSSR
jgi:hypothetical protein